MQEIGRRKRRRCNKTPEENEVVHQICFMFEMNNKLIFVFECEMKWLNRFCFGGKTVFWREKKNKCPATEKKSCDTMERRDSFLCNSNTTTCGVVPGALSTGNLESTAGFVNNNKENVAVNDFAGFGIDGELIFSQILQNLQQVQYVEQFRLELEKLFQQPQQLQQINGLFSSQQLGSQNFVSVPSKTNPNVHYQAILPKPEVRQLMIPSSGNINNSKETEGFCSKVNSFSQTKAENVATPLNSDNECNQAVNKEIGSKVVTSKTEDDVKRSKKKENERSFQDILEQDFHINIIYKDENESCGKKDEETTEEKGPFFDLYNYEPFCQKKNKKMSKFIEFVAVPFLFFQKY